MSQSIAEIKARLSIEQLVMEAGQPVTYTRNIRCPFHDDQSPSMRLYEDGRFHCFACGVHGDVLDWIGYLLFGTQYSPDRHLRDVIDHVGGLEVKPLPKVTPPKRKRPRPAARELSRLADQYHSALTLAARGFWHSRGLNDETIARFRLGWDAGTRRYTIPATYRGITFGIKKRATGDGGDKYISEAGSRVGLFNSDALNDTDWIFVVEGEIDCMTMAQAGIPCVSTTGGAGTFRAHWARFFAHCRHVFYIADNDDAGIEGALKVRGIIPRARLVTVPGGHKDVNDYHMAGGDMAELLASATASWQ